MDRKTNHSVRKTTIKTLRKAGVARDKIKHVTGHKSAKNPRPFTGTCKVRNETKRNQMKRNETDGNEI
jgi:hypothetical protein